MMKIVQFCKDAVVDPNCSANLVNYNVADGSNFTPTWIEIPEHVGEHFLITDLKIGKNSQLISTGALPAELFSETNIDRFDIEHFGLKIDIVKPLDNRVVLSVTNISDRAQRFSANLIGFDDQIPDDFQLNYALGFGYTQVRPLSAVNISVQPQLAFIPRKIFLPHIVLAHFNVTDIFCGSKSQDDVGPRSMVRDEDLRTGLKSDIHLVPDAVVPTQRFLTIEATSQSEKVENFCAAVLGPPAIRDFKPKAASQGENR